MNPEYPKISLLAYGLGKSEQANLHKIHMPYLTGPWWYITRNIE